jgi:tellurite methyltransferase
LIALKVGLEKAKRYAKEAGVEISVIHDDIKTYRIDKTYDVMFSTGTLHYLPPDVKGLRFRDYKNKTSLVGISAFSVFVKKPFIEKALDAEKEVFHFKSGGLMGYYWDWEILFTQEAIFDCKSGGVPHKHAVNRVIARRYGKKRKS